MNQIASASVKLIPRPTRVEQLPDIYVGEYMRLWNHYAFREWVASRPDPTNARFRFLDPTKTWWKAYFGDTDRSRQRVYFSGGD